MKDDRDPLKSGKLRKPERQIIYCRQSSFDPSGVAYHANFHWDPPPFHFPLHFNETAQLCRTKSLKPIVPQRTASFSHRPSRSFRPRHMIPRISAQHTRPAHPFRRSGIFQTNTPARALCVGCVWRVRLTTFRHSARCREASLVVRARALTVGA